MTLDAVSTLWRSRDQDCIKEEQTATVLLWVRALVCVCGRGAEIVKGADIHTCLCAQQCMTFLILRKQTEEHMGVSPRVLECYLHEGKNFSLITLPVMRLSYTIKNHKAHIRVCSKVPAPLLQSLCLNSSTNVVELEMYLPLIQNTI
jgi:hypothetical protein